MIRTALKTYYGCWMAILRHTSFANEYYGKTLNVDLVRRLYLQCLLTPALVSEINSEAEWDGVCSDAQEIG